MLTDEELEREYNARARVPDHPGYFARWERDSDFVRATLPCTLDVPYGPDPRHRMDLFPAANARGSLVFIHGGYWRSLDKALFSWLAPAWVAAGVSVVMPNYRLCPAVRIDDIVEDVILFANTLFETGASHGIATDRVVVAGHSAGGHLTGALFAAPPDRLRFDPARIVGGVPISGLFDFAALARIPFNADFRLDDAAVQRLSLQHRRASLTAPLVVAVGADESAEFRRQSRLIADAWSPQVKSLLVLPGTHHFSIVDAFSERGQPLYEQTLALF